MTDAPTRWLDPEATARYISARVDETRRQDFGVLSAWADIGKDAA